MINEPSFFLGFIPRGEVESHYINFAERLEERCGVPALSKRVRAHLTVVPPFSAPSQGVVKVVVREHVRAVTPFTITVSDFGWFSDDPADQTLYLNVVQNPQLAVFAYALTEAVKTATKGWMRKRVGGKEFHPHISLARHLSHDTTKQVSRFVAREGHKRFENVLLDPLTLFRVEGSSYVVETDFKLAYA